MSRNYHKGRDRQGSDDKEPASHGEGSGCQPKALGILDRGKLERNWFVRVLQKIPLPALLGRWGGIVCPQVSDDCQVMIMKGLGGARPEQAKGIGRDILERRGSGTYLQSSLAGLDSCMTAGTHFTSFSSSVK